MKVIPEMYLMKVIPEMYLMKVIPKDINTIAKISMLHTINSLLFSNNKSSVYK
jgi:hypothetical protein